MYNSNGTPTPSWSPPPIQAPVPQHPQRPGPMSFGNASAGGSYPGSPKPHQPRGAPQQPQFRQQPQQQPFQQQQQSYAQQQAYSAPFAGTSSATASAAGFTPQPYHRPTPHNPLQHQASGGDVYASVPTPASQSGFGQSAAAPYAAGPSGFMNPGATPMQQQQQQQWGTNLISDFQSSAAGQLGMQIGGKAFEQAQQNLNKNINRWINIPHLKYYFNVSNSYVLNKIRLLLFPFRHPHMSWARLVLRSEQSGQMEGYKPPREDLNAPDLYIPVMTFVTYIILVGIKLGLADAAAPAKDRSFTPDVLGITGTTALVIVSTEVLLLKLGFYLLNVTTEVPFLDLVSYSGYKFLGVIVSLIAAILAPASWITFAVHAYGMLCLGFFTLRSLKYIILPEGFTTVDPSARQRRIQFLFIVAAVQIVLSTTLVFWVARVKLPS
ncbi:YIF1-domain-containing protein [Fimicolochytrium jonesii]|uniref:YIF1-domain-containing protein n=1 Tax=Fimicolochytrium jonesii TaxID=1396493 RepID=UPI0022FEC23E|nr:YIF1-domain-containing protein [Fimicolochytrium jonesii]KAI8822564.1 YIF1-domain-containing protein [Fimicolochytrium jonesii]